MTVRPDSDPLPRCPSAGQPLTDVRNAPVIALWGFREYSLEAFGGAVDGAGRTDPPGLIRPSHEERTISLADGTGRRHPGRTQPGASSDGTSDEDWASTGVCAERVPGDEHGQADHAPAPARSANSSTTAPNLRGQTGRAALVALQSSGKLFAEGQEAAPGRAHQAAHPHPDRHAAGTVRHLGDRQLVMAVSTRTASGTPRGLQASAPTPGSNMPPSAMASMAGGYNPENTRPTSPLIFRTRCQRRSSRGL